MDYYNKDRDNVNHLSDTNKARELNWQEYGLANEEPITELFNKHNKAGNHWSKLTLSKQEEKTRSHIKNIGAKRADIDISSGFSSCSIKTINKVMLEEKDGKLIEVIELPYLKKVKGVSRPDHWNRYLGNKSSMIIVGKGASSPLRVNWSASLKGKSVKQTSRGKDYNKTWEQILPEFTTLVIGENQYTFDFNKLSNIIKDNFMSLTIKPFVQYDCSNLDVEQTEISKIVVPVELLKPALLFSSKLPEAYIPDVHNFYQNNVSSKIHREVPVCNTLHCTH